MLAVSSGLAAFVYGFSHAQSSGWSSSLTIACLASSVVLSASFVAIESRSRNPVLPLRLLEDPNRSERLVFHPDWRIVGAIGYLWFHIAVLFACFAAAAGRTPPLASVVLAYQIGYLSNFIPVPGGIGVLDGTLIGMLVLYGVGGTVGTAATLAYHAISLWVPALWGTIAFIMLQRTKRQPIILRDPPECLGRPG
jgi:uncharacterized membrane protein YbhN (UPF0104 family)